MSGDLSAFGPFFALDTHSPDSPPRQPWRPMRELTDTPDVLAERVSGVRAHLARAGGLSPDDVELRVAASVTHLGLAARLISPVLALAVTQARVLDVTLDRTRWQPALGGPFPLSVPADALDAPTLTDRAELVERIRKGLLDGPIRELTEAASTLSVSGQVLWGNIASAVNGATTMIGKARPDLAADTQDIAALLLHRPPLDGTAGTPPGPGFRRRSCCLIYRAAPHHAGPVCGDCVLTA